MIDVRMPGIVVVCGAQWASLAVAPVEQLPDRSDARRFVLRFELSQLCCREARCNDRFDCAIAQMDDANHYCERGAHA
jgi:hypothetical protein